MARPVAFGVTVQEAYDFLADPGQRPRWQSSLRRVDDVRGSGEAGTTWIDVTVPGLRPRMRVTEGTPPTRWAETGRWGPFSADLTLDFVPDGAECRVDADFVVRASGVLRPLGPVLTVLARPVVAADLRRASALLGD